MADPVPDTTIRPNALVCTECFGLGSVDNDGWARDRCILCDGIGVLPACIAAERADNAAIDTFSDALRAKMTASRAKGRGGWQTCPVSDLWAMLREHVEKGDPRDVACFAMMIHHNQAREAADGR